MNRDVKRGLGSLTLLCGVALSQLACAAVPAGGSLSLWDGECRNGWQLWTADGVCPLASGPSYQGDASYATTPKFPGAGFQWDHPAFSTAPYSAITFAINGGSAAGHVLTFSGTRSDGSAPVTFTLPALKANSWQTVTIPLSTLGLDQITDLHHLTLRDSSADSTATATFYVTDFAFTARKAPLFASIKINTAATLGVIDPRTAGLNVAVWDPNLGDAQATTSVIQQLAPGSLRFPGGSTADTYHWASNTVEDSSAPLASNGKTFAALNEAQGAAAYITVNYGSGTPQEAAAWVAWANGVPGSQQPLGVDSKGRNWNTVGYWAGLRAATPLAQDDGLNHLRANHTGSYGWKYFEVGNEVYGGWEHDLHGADGSGLVGTAHDPATYGVAAAVFISHMKAVDPSVRVGVVVDVGPVMEGLHADDYCSAVCNTALSVPSKAGGTHYGWTPVVLNRLSSAGVRPDFVTYHYYPIYAGLENDALVLGTPVVLSTWAARLKSQIANYWTGANGTGIELALGEANIGGSGKQTTSLVDGLFYAEHYGQMLTAGFTSGAWWALHNLEYASGNMSTSLYGYRLFGSEGLASDGLAGNGSGANTASATTAGTLFPAAQVFAQLKPFRAPGAALVQTISSDPMLSAYSSVQPDGQLNVLVINKSATDSITGVITTSGLQRRGGVIHISTYGKGEDASGTGPTASSTLAAGHALVHRFAPYSSTLFTVPAP